MYMARPRKWLSFAVWAGLLGTTASAGGEPDAQSRALLERATLRIDSGHHTAPVTSIAASRDGAFLVTGSEDRSARLWDVHSGALLRTLRPPSTADGDEGKIYAVAVSPDGRMVAVGGITRFFDDRSQRGSAVYLFDAGNGAFLRRLPGADLQSRDHRLERIVFSTDGKRLAVTRGIERSVGLYDLAAAASLDGALPQGADFVDADFDALGCLLLGRSDGAVLYDRDLHRAAQASGLERLRRARFSPDGRKIALLLGDGRVEVRQRDLRPGQPLKSGAGLPALELATAVAFSLDGKNIFVAAQLRGRPQAVIRRWSLRAPEVAHDTSVPVPLLSELAALPQGGLAFAATDGSWGIVEPDGTLKLHEGTRVLSAPPEALLVNDSGEEVEVRLGPRPEGRLRFEVSALELRRGASEDARLRPPLFEPPAPHRIAGWQHRPPVYLDDGALFGSGEDPAALAVSPARDAFSIGAARQLFGYRFQRGAADACPHQPSPRSQLLPPCFLRPVPSPVRAVNYSGDGRYLVALLADGTVRWYQAHDGRERLALLLPGQPDDGRWLLFRPDGLYAAAPGGADLAGFQLNHPDERGPDFFPLSQLKRSLERPEQVAATLTDAAKGPAAAVSLQQEQLPPLLTVLEPADGAPITDVTVWIKVAVRALSAQPVTALRARVDGRPIEVQPRAAAPFAAGEPMTLKLTVPPRDCVLALFAESPAGAGPPAMLRLRWRGSSLPEASAATPAARALRVLAIGVDDYARPELRLRYPGKDARDLAAALGQQQGPGRLYQRVDLRVLTGREATKASILEALDWLQHRSRAADTSLLFFAGHGISEPTTGEYYFLPTDAEPTNALRTMVPASTFQQVLASLPGRVVLLLDTCYSGSVLGKPGRRARGPAPLSRALSELASVENGIVVMAASNGDQVSLEDSAWQNGAFTKALLEGLSGRADVRKTGRVTINMLDLYVSERVRELTAGSQTPATAKPITVVDFPLVLSR